MKLSKKIHHLWVMTMIGIFITGVAVVSGQAALTPEQVSSMAATAAAGDSGAVKTLAQETLAAVTADLVASGLTGDELAGQISAAINELAAAIPQDSANQNSLLESVFEGATVGAINAVQGAIGADPNLADLDLVGAATAGSAGAVALFTAANPTIDSATLIAAVNTGSTTAGVDPANLEAFEAADAGTGPPAPAAPPAPEIEAPDPDTAGSPI